MAKKIQVNRLALPDWTTRLASKTQPLESKDFFQLVEGLAKPIDLIGERLFSLELLQENSGLEYYVGTQEPENPNPNALWLHVDDTTDLMVFKRRNNSNTAWVTLGLENLIVTTPLMRNKVASYYHSVDDPIVQFDIPIDLEFNSEQDTLLIFKNSVLLTDKVDYNINSYEAHLNGKLTKIYKVVLLGNKTLAKGDYFDIIRLYSTYEQLKLLEKYVTKESYDELKEKHNLLLDLLLRKGIITSEEKYINSI